MGTEIVYANLFYTVPYIGTAVSATANAYHASVGLFWFARPHPPEQKRKDPTEAETLDAAD